MHYLILIVPSILSFLMIRENRLVGRCIERMFGLPNGSAYRRSERHSKLIAVFKWPFLMMLLGLTVPTPLSFDFLLTFIAGFIIGWKDFRRKEPKLLEPKELWEG